MSNIYDNWYVCQFKLRVTSPKFDEMRFWCMDKFGKIKKTRPNNIWDWNYIPDDHTIFVFKNKDDYTQFILTWG